MAKSPEEKKAINLANQHQRKSLLTPQKDSMMETGLVLTDVGTSNDWVSCDKCGFAYLKSKNHVCENSKD